jgi:hypothetical protein
MFFTLFDDVNRCMALLLVKITNDSIARSIERTEYLEHSADVEIGLVLQKTGSLSQCWSRCMAGAALSRSALSPMQTNLSAGYSRLAFVLSRHAE